MFSENVILLADLGIVPSWCIPSALVGRARCAWSARMHMANHVSEHTPFLLTERYDSMRGIVVDAH
eukprot:2374618-Amphidinium_carterae.1